MKRALCHLLVGAIAVGAGFINIGLGIIVMVIGYTALVRE
jgi:hypothetical protein